MFLKRIAAEPDIARIPVMVDSSKWSVIEAGLKCVSGKPIVNSISHEGGRGAVPRARAQMPGLWRGSRRHGVRRGRPGRYGRAQNLDLRASLQAVDPDGTDAHDIIFDPNIFAVATGIDEHAARARLHRGLRANPPPLPRHPHRRRPVEPQLLLPRQRPRAPRDAQRLPLSCDSRGHGHGHRQRRPARRLRRDRSRASRSLRGRRSSTAATMRPSG